MKFYTRFRRPVFKGVDFSESTSLTQKQFAKDCDINVMIRRYLSGDASAMRIRGGSPVISDASIAPESLHDAMNRVKLAECLWNEIPQAVRHSYGSYERFLAAYDAQLATVAQSPIQSSKDTSDSTTVTPKGAADGSNISASVPSNT